MKLFLSALIALTASCWAGLPPTTSKGLGDTTNVTTFNYQFPNLFPTHTGVTVSLSTNIPDQNISASNIDWSTGNLFSKTLSANTTFTFSSQTSGQVIVVRLTNTASNWTVTWPTVQWPGGSAPTMTIGAHSDVYTFVYDGTNTFGAYVQNY